MSGWGRESLCGGARSEGCPELLALRIHIYGIAENVFQPSIDDGKAAVAERLQNFVQHNQMIGVDQAGVLGLSVTGSDRAVSGARQVVDGWR